MLNIKDIRDNCKSLDSRGDRIAIIVLYQKNKNQGTVVGMSTNSSSMFC